MLQTCHVIRNRVQHCSSTLIKRLTTQQIKKEVINLPRDFRGHTAFALYNVLTQEECNKYIKVSEDIGYEAAKVGKNQIVLTDIRQSSRCLWDTSEETNKIWNIIKPYIPATWQNRKVIGLNESIERTCFPTMRCWWKNFTKPGFTAKDKNIRLTFDGFGYCFRLRFLRYDPGEYFKPHYDGRYERETGEKSYFTIQVYLNEGYKGGSTNFLSRNRKEKVEFIQKLGSILVFQHDMLHEGSELISGRKYTIRTDIMYSSITI
ncbi:unnamed protein product [Mytilus coruscus]|uniref:Prolyl 4-hydroxylase alpha subunit domain-containing protein n=1 Tax=Mytilus coruscus TaxID=42192 RepID=A0A6J8C2P9_MYTCO|nr:unnamed protein product [Mytilus coruscus]